MAPSFSARRVVAVRPFIVAAFLALLTSPGHAGYSFETPPSHPDWEPGIEAIQRLDWPSAITHLAQVVRNEPDNADAHNALGFAYASSNRINDAIRHFREALRLNPRHRSAHENIGEAYLKTGNNAKAREHLAALERLCGRTCDEQRNLAKAIAAAK
jgi:Flp pilus assembly protein TadD